MILLSDITYRRLQIRLGFRNGLTMDQVKARIELDDEQKQTEESDTKKSINDKLDVLEEGKKLASVTTKENIEK